MVAFARRHARELAAGPSGFFQLSLASAIDSRWARNGARRYVDRFEAATGREPDRVGTFAGALKYGAYDRRTRWLFRLAALVTGLDTDASRDHEYTDWDEVDRFASGFGEIVERAQEADRDGARTAA